MAEIDTSSYRHTQADPFSAAAGTVGLANALTQNRMLQSQFGAQKAIGQAYSGAIDPDTGVYDPGAANRAIHADPNAAYGAPEAIQRNVGIQGGQIANAGSLATSRQSMLSDAIGEANAQPTRQGMIAVLSHRVANGLLPPDVFTSIVSSLPPDDKGSKSYMATRAAGMISTPAQAAPVQAGVNPDLTPKVVTGGKAAEMARQPEGFAGGAAPGATEVAAADKKAIFEDQLRASNTMGNVRPLQQALPLISQLGSANFGPGSAEFSKIKGALTTAGIIDPNTSDLQVRQEANKYLLKYAAGAQSAGRSDSALSAALGSNPNLDLTQPANLALVKNQIGMDRMDAATTKAFGTDAKPGQTYSEYKSGYNQATDPRAFSFDIMSPDERAKVKASLGATTSPAYKKFVHSYNLAKQSGMLTPGGAQ
jgi:hypothetical protein